MKVYFISGSRAVSDAAFDICTGFLGDAEWCCFVLTGQADRDVCDDTDPEDL